MIRDVYSGSRFLSIRDPDHGSEVKITLDPGSGAATPLFTFIFRLDPDS